MSIILPNFLIKLNHLIHDNFTGTTTSGGSTDKLTLVDTALKKFDDGYFGDPNRDPAWWVYYLSQLRSIKAFSGGAGTITVNSAFAAATLTATAYSLHRFDRDQKIAACNQALIAAYPWYYKRVEDEATLTGTGASDNEYTVPATFTEFPEQIFEKQVSGDKITYVPVTDFVVKEKAGSLYFYANITIGNKILLIGKTPLTAFTTDASTTELDNAQAEIVAYLAAAYMCRMISASINSSDAGRYDTLATRYENQFFARVGLTQKPRIVSNKLDWGWLGEG